MHYDNVVVDDERYLESPDSTVVHLRTSVEALRFLRAMADDSIGSLWLDHDLGGDDTIRPVVDYLEELVFLNSPVSIERILVHTANPVGADMITRSRLLGATYRVARVDLSNFGVGRT